MDYRDSHRALQDAFDTRRLADRLASVAGDDVSGFREFLEARRHVLHRDLGRRRPAPQCSYKGGDPGFVRVVDDHTIAFPVYDGNGMFLDHRQRHREPARRAAVQSTSSTARGSRVNGEASVESGTDPLVADFRRRHRLRRTGVRATAAGLPPTAGATSTTRRPRLRVSRSVRRPRAADQPPVPDVEARDECVRRAPLRRRRPQPRSTRRSAPAGAAVTGCPTSEAPRVRGHAAWTIPSLDPDTRAR